MFGFNFHIGDWDSSTKLDTPTERGVYLDHLIVYYSNEAPLKRSLCERIARAYTDVEREAQKYVLGRYFVLVGDEYVNHRCEEEIAKARAKSNKAAESAKSRWNKKNHKKNSVNAEVSHEDRNLSDDANAMRTHSECISEGNADAMLSKIQYPISNIDIDINKPASTSAENGGDADLPFDDVPPMDEVPEDVKAQTERKPLDKPEQTKAEKKQSSRGQLQRLLAELEKDGIDEGLLSAYLDLRKKKRMGSFEGKPLALYRADCEKAGITIKQAMETSVKRGWVGAFAEGSNNFGRGGARKSADNWTGREKRESEREEYML